jgi:uncharacterized protein YggE
VSFSTSPEPSAVPAGETTSDGIRVFGTGASAGSPDVVRMHLVATASRPRLAEALTASEDAARRIRDVLTRFGVTGEDAATSGLSINAEQVWDEQHGPRITGFRSDHTLAITVRDVHAVGAVLGEALVAGGDDVRLNGVEFAVEDDVALRTQARERAWQDALAKAEQLAGLAGRHLGVVLDITESGQMAGPPVPIPRLMAAAAAPDVAAEPGRVAVEVTLQVRWALL